MDDTLDFEVEIGPGSDDEYPVTARARDSGSEALGTLRSPRSSRDFDRQLAGIRDAVLASSALVRRIASAEEQPVQALGRQLFESLLSGDVRALYGASYQRAREQGKHLRLVLRIRPPELARLPWEFLYDAGQDDYLGLRLPLVRSPQVLEPQRPLPVAPPLRILAMAARPGDQEALEVSEEQRRLQEALAELEADGLVRLAWVEGQTYDDLEDALDKGPWHIFHFIGHGGFDSSTDQGLLAFATARGRTDLVTADDFSRLLSDQFMLRLVVLNACDTGRGSALDSFSGIAAALVRRGIPAVVAMQFEISDQAAIQFAQTFYETIAVKRQPVERAVTRGRGRIKRIKAGTLEWGTPVLYLRSRNSEIFDLSGWTELLRGGESPSDSDEQGMEALYTEAMAAFYSDRWDRAVELLGQLVSQRRDYRDTVPKLNQARRQMQLASGYAEACAAADAGEWSRAIAGFGKVMEVDPDYRDARERLDNARRSREVGELRAEARRLHGQRQWAAVTTIGERLRALNPQAADPDGLVAAARTEMTRAEHEERLAADYAEGMRYMKEGGWTAAGAVFERITQVNPTYRDVKTLHAVTRRALPGTKLVNEIASLINSRPSAIRAVEVGGGFTAVAFSADGSQVATANRTNQARIWDILTGRELLVVGQRGFMKEMADAAFSPDSRRLATARGTEARVWDAQSGAELLKVNHRGLLAGVALGPDGRWLATSSMDGTTRVWDVQSGKGLHRVSHVDSVVAVAFAPHGRWFATASSDRTARVWDAGSGDELARLPHEGLVVAVAFAPDGRWLATASSDRTARVWEVGSGEELATMPHEGTVVGLAFASENPWLLTASAIGVKRVGAVLRWDLMTEVRVHEQS